MRQKYAHEQILNCDKLLKCQKASILGYQKVANNERKDALSDEMHRKVHKDNQNQAGGALDVNQRCDSVILELSMKNQNVKGYFNQKTHDENVRYENQTEQLNCSG